MATPRLTPVLRYIRQIGAPSADDDTDSELLRRFARTGDAAAFERLVRRHGPMVLGVCRRVLHDGPDADDAFQATFLLLVRKAGSLRQPDRLGPWLHGVAYRTALKARARIARRREGPVMVEPAAPSAAEDMAHDLRPALDAAIDRLPRRERTAVVLCYLQGLTYEEAAHKQRCPLGTLAARLARARERLRVWLTRQGLAPAAGAVTAGLTADAPALPPALVEVTVRAAAALATGARDGVTTEAILSLVEGVRRAMILNTLKMVLIVAAGLGLVGAGTGILAYHALASEPPAKSEVVPPPPVAAAKDANKPQAKERPIPLTWLRQPQPDVYRLDTGDLLGIFVDGVIGSDQNPPPLLMIPAVSPGSNMPPPTSGYPIVVREGGLLDLPLIQPLNVRGKTIAETHQIIRRAYLDAKTLVGNPRTMVSLARPRTYQVTVVRYDAPAQSGDAGRPLTFVLDLQAYNNDVLNALSRGGGLPGRESNGTIVILRAQGSGAAGSKQIRIPWSLKESEPPFWPEDIVLQNGDVVLVEATDAKMDRPGDTAKGSAVSDTPPIVTLAVATPDGHVLIQVPGSADRTPAAKGPWQTFGPSQLQAFETDGRPIDGKALAERLQKMTTVLAAPDGRKPDTLVLQAVKPGTPVLVIQEAQAK